MQPLKGDRYGTHIISLEQLGIAGGVSLCRVPHPSDRDVPGR